MSESFSQLFLFYASPGWCLGKYFINKKIKQNVQYQYIMHLGERYERGTSIPFCLWDRN